MRNRVTIKIVLTTALSLFAVTLALLSVVWQWQSERAGEIQTDYGRQVINAVARAGPAYLEKDPRLLYRTVLESLPTRVRPASVTLEGPSSGDRAYWVDHAANSGTADPDVSDDPLFAIAGWLCALPNTMDVRSDLPIDPDRPSAGRAELTAVLDLREQKAQDASVIAQILQIVLPIALACLLALYAGVRHWVQRPAEAIIRVARRIAAGDQELRLAITTRDEFGHIMRAFNDLIDSLLTTQQQADTDGLTQVFNHRYLQEKIGETLQAAIDGRRSMAIVLIDLDKFKLLNDNYGHLVGDRFLQQTAAVLRRAVHLDGIVGRYGGDEFLIVLPHAGRERAAQAEERIRALMGAEQFRPSPAADPLPILFSMGLAVFPENGRTAQELIAYADAALYTEKQGGYNLVELIGDIESEYALKFADSPRSAQPGGLFGTLFSLVSAVDHKDSYTKRHSMHVADWAVRLGRAVGLPAPTLRALQVAGLLHDVGKIGIPDSILQKPAPLSEKEQEIMAGHVALSERLIQEVPYQDEVLAAVACHHERWDGLGYPRGIKGSEMPVAGRIMALVDAYSAMCLDRPYRMAIDAAEICRRLRQGAGSQFDPDLVEAFVALIESHAPEELRPAENAEEGTPASLTQSRSRPTRKLPDAA